MFTGRERSEEGGPEPAVIDGHLCASCAGSATFQEFGVNALGGLVGADVLAACSDDACQDFCARAESPAWNRFRCARGEHSTFLLQQATQDGVEHYLDAHLYWRPLDPVITTLRNFKRNHPMQSGPQCLADNTDIIEIVAQQSSV